MSERNRGTGKEEDPAPAPSEHPKPAAEVLPCPKCGALALIVLGETSHSIVRRCAACAEISLQRRE